LSSIVMEQNSKRPARFSRRWRGTRTAPRPDECPLVARSGRLESTDCVEDPSGDESGQRLRRQSGRRDSSPPRYVAKIGAG
jgi:hypothetical protein